MKEFSAQTGGRYTYADDLENLQELALAFSQIFDNCDNFIVSGCEVSGNSISAGYVFINGKIRYFSGSSNVASWPQHIYEHNTTESVAYESGGSKIGRKIYGCAMAQAVPTALDALTGKSPQSITVQSSGGTTMKDAFIGKYALLLNPTAGMQTVNSQANFAKKVTMNGGASIKAGATITNGTLNANVGYADGNFFIESIGAGSRYKFVFDHTSGFQFYVNGAEVAVIGAQAIIFNRPVTSATGVFGGLALTNGSLYQTSANATASININMFGYAGGTSQFRNTFIGNGKGVVIIGVDGSTQDISLNGSTCISAGKVDALVLKSNVLKNNNSLTNAIVWKDSANSEIAKVGFVNTSDQVFSISVPDFNVSILGHSFVDLGPVIKENGVLLSERYTTHEFFANEMNKKADAADVYTKKESDGKYGAAQGGLAQFISPAFDAARCRGQIGAAAIDDLKAYPKNTNCLSDMATTEANKKKIRDNIGAAGVNDFQTKLYDSGWIKIKEELYIRQIGNMVSIQGVISTTHAGNVFCIPNTISAPTHAVKHTIAFANNRSWVCVIRKGQRICDTVYCDSSCGRATEFSLTYMV